MGSSTSARAMLTRWRWPPLSSCGYRRPRLLGVEPHRPSTRRPRAGLGARATVHEQAEGHRILDVHARIERRVGVLEDHLHVAAQALHAGGRAARTCPRRRRSGSPHPARSVGEPGGPVSISRSRTRRRCRAISPAIARRTTRRRPRCTQACTRLQHPAAHREVLAQPSRLQQRPRAPWTLPPYNAHVHGVAQTVAEQVERHRGHEDHAAGERGDQRVDVDRLRSVFSISPHSAFGGVTPSPRKLGRRQDDDTDADTGCWRYTKIGASTLAII